MRTDRMNYYISFCLMCIVLSVFCLCMEFFFSVGSFFRVFPVRRTTTPLSRQLGNGVR